MASLTRRRSNQQGFSLIETVVAMLIAGIIIGGMVSGFVFSLRMAESSAYSLAASTLAAQGYEQTKAAKWDAVIFPWVDEVVSGNFPPKGYILDVPANGTNLVYATNYTTISTVSTNPLLKLIQVDCVYRFPNRGFLTNSIISCRAAETGQQNALPSAPPIVTPPPPPPLGTTPKQNTRGDKKKNRDD